MSNFLTDFEDYKNDPDSVELKDSYEVYYTPNQVYSERLAYLSVDGLVRIQRGSNVIKSRDFKALSKNPSFVALVNSGVITATGEPVQTPSPPLPSVVSADEVLDE